MSSSSSRIVPQNQQTVHVFRQIAAAPNTEKPICQMNDTTARDLKVIWASLADVATRWRGKEDARIPGQPADRKAFWGAFSLTHEYNTLPAFREFIQTAEFKEFVTGSLKNNKSMVAIDLGCGNGGAIPRLMNLGWHVIAVDNSKEMITYLKTRYAKEIAANQLEVVESDVEAFVPKEPADLLVASDILPYLDPAQFQATWTKIHDTFLKENGFFISNVFRSDVSAQMTPKINVTKEFGAWLFPDRRMIRALLTQTGYEVKTCNFRYENPEDTETLTIQFVAKKLKIETNTNSDANSN